MVCPVVRPTVDTAHQAGVTEIDVSGSGWCLCGVANKQGKGAVWGGRWDS